MEPHHLVPPVLLVVDVRLRVQLQMPMVLVADVEGLQVAALRAARGVLELRQDSSRALEVLLKNLLEAPRLVRTAH